jgi:hypothetical protein
MRNIDVSKLVKSKKSLILFLAVLMILTTFSCKQSSIFFMVSNEVKPKDPKISGAPTKIVAGTSNLYVASKKDVWSYDGNTWNKMVDQPPTNSTFSDVAADETSSELFVQTTSRELFKYDGTWTKITNAASSSFPNLAGIYMANGQLFAAARDDEDDPDPDYAVLWYDGTKLVSLEDYNGTGGKLTGVVYAGSNYYLATLGGVRVISGTVSASSTLTSLSMPGGIGNVTGIIASPSKTEILAVTSDGEIVIGDLTALPVTFRYDNPEDYLNGALNIAETESGRQVLMIGRGNTSGNAYEYGYVELVLDDNSTDGVLNDDMFPNTINLDPPGEGTHSSIETGSRSNAEYDSSLGREVVTSIIQSHLGDKTLFASTNLKGLWSYRDGEWNAED